MTIYTRFGAIVTLATPVDWNTGWVMVFRASDGKPHEYHIGELKADGGINEIQAASDRLEHPEDNLCRDCGLPMEAHQQEQRQAPPITIVTCKNRDCTLYGVTLSTDQYAGLTDLQLEGYRKMVAQMKERNSRGEA